jgi:hypothetical protein
MKLAAVSGWAAAKRAGPGLFPVDRVADLT